MNFNSLLRSFQASKLCYRATYTFPLVRRLSSSSNEVKKGSCKDQNRHNFTAFQSFKVKTQSTGRWFPLPRSYCSLSTSDSQDDRLEREETVASHQEHPNRRTIFVGSLNYLTDEEKLHQHFSIYGEIEHLRVIRYTTSSVPKNYAFVVFKSVESVEKALQGKNFLDSRRLEVARHDRDLTHERKIYLKGIPLDLEINDIREYFSQYGEIKSVDIPMTGKKRRDYGFIEFSSENSAIKALQQQNHEVKGHALQISTCIAKRRKSVPGKVVVDLLPEDITLEAVRKYFEQFGQLNSIDMVFKRDSTSSKNFAFLCFQNQEIADEVSSSKRSHFIDGQQLIVKPMHSTTKSRPASSREKKIFVEGIPLGKTEDEILSYFNQFGEAIHLHLIHSWEERQLDQCGILRFKRKKDVDNLLAQQELKMDDSLLKVRRLGFTAETSSDYTPLYSEFRKKHQINSTDTKIKESPESTEESIQGNSLNFYPKLD